MEAETITDDTHIWINTSFYEYNQSLTIDESTSRLFQNVQEGFAKDINYWGLWGYWGFNDRLTAVVIHYCGQITFTETSALSVFFWLYTWNEPVVVGSALVVGVRGLCRIANNGLDIELFDGNTHNSDVRKMVHTTINITICFINIPCGEKRWKSHLLHWFQSLK